MKTTTLQPGQLVKYARPELGEESLRFIVREITCDAPARAKIALIGDEAIAPVETVSPDEITAA